MTNCQNPILLVICKKKERGGGGGTFAKSDGGAEVFGHDFPFRGFDFRRFEDGAENLERVVEG